MTDEPFVRILAIDVEQDVILARQEGRALAQRLGFAAVDQARITTAISELARNIVIYGVRGTVTLLDLSRRGSRPGLEIRFDDEGPGIADMELAMQQGYTSGKGLGAGLPGSKRLMDEFEVRTAVGEGLHIVVRKWR